MFFFYVFLNPDWSAYSEVILVPSIATKWPTSVLLYVGTHSNSTKVSISPGKSILIGLKSQNRFLIELELERFSVIQYYLYYYLWLIGIGCWICVRSLFCWISNWLWTGVCSSLTSSVALFVISTRHVSTWIFCPDRALAVLTTIHTFQRKNWLDINFD